MVCFYCGKPEHTMNKRYGKKNKVSLNTEQVNKDKDNRISFLTELVFDTCLSNVECVSESNNVENAVDFYIDSGCTDHMIF